MNMVDLITGRKEQRKYSNIETQGSSWDSKSQFHIIDLCKN